MISSALYVRSAITIAALTIILAGVFAADMRAESNDLFLVSMGYDDLRTGERVPSEIHRLEQEPVRLETVWASDPGVTTHRISAYSVAKFLLIQEGDNAAGAKLRVFPMDKVRDTKTIPIDAPGGRSDFRIYRSSLDPEDIVIDAEPHFLTIF